MKHFSYLALVSLLLSTGCSTNYFLVASESETSIYASEKGSDVITTITAKKQFLIRGKKSRRYTYFGTRTGYTNYSSSWKTLAKLTHGQAKRLAFTIENGYSLTGSSNYGNSISRSSGGTVHVKGYTRKDGTYVRPHTMSAPRRH